ncbi:MAG: transposase [Deltaproteobacteria bacterium]|nr:transposase [Deltaproteobacteria bacterium]
MPRLARLDAPGVLHHVIGRGIERRKIFLDAIDRNDFVSRLAALTEGEGTAIYAWVLMSNHFHLLCKTKMRPLSSSMRKLLTGYVVNFNKRHKRDGHLFQNRYKSIICQEDAYLKELVRYIHLNLIRGGMVKNIRELNKSPWSGHSALMGNVERDWQDTKYVLSFFGRGAAGKRNYLEFVKRGIPLGQRSELVGGGLIRSLGGWAEVLSMRRRGQEQVSDQRILGDGEFVETVLSEMDDLGKENFRLGTKKIDLRTLADKVCNVHDVSLGELRSGSRRHEIVEARWILSWLAVKEFGYSGAEVARYLGVTTSCVNRAVSSGQRPKKENYI